MHFGIQRRFLKVWIAEQLLDIVEALPRFNSGFIKYLQQMRGLERKRAEEDRSAVQLPEGAKLTLAALTLYQVYPIEEFETITKSILSTFGREVYDSSSGTLKELRGEEAMLWGSSQRVVGHLSHNKSGFYFPVAHRYVKGLPRRTKHIAVEILRVVPSTFIVSFEVQLEASVSEQLNAIHSARYLGETQFRYWIPLGNLCTGVRFI